MSEVRTELALREWRYGQTQAERLAAGLLHLDAFEAVDPQHPLGGPDGLKDVLCRKDGLTFVAAAYFPPTHPTFHDVKKKFRHDLKGVSANAAQGIVFVVNQPLTVSEREELLVIGSGIRTEIYHLERIRGLLDAPKGCGLRLEYLRIPMTEEEQWAFWSTLNQDVMRRLAESETRRDAHHRLLEAKVDILLLRTSAFEVDLHRGPSALAAVAVGAQNVDMATASLTITTLCWLHRIITENGGLNDAVRGKLRAVKVWIGPPGATIDTASYVPPPPEDVLRLTQEWVATWTASYGALRGKVKDDVAFALARSHHRFLSIHPFLDANGRLSRSIMDQAARELLAQSIGVELVAEPSKYYAALREADRGNLEPLQRRILAALQ